jgi:ribokinase
VVVVGSVNVDLLVSVPRHPEAGETVLGGDAAHSPGGKGANQAVAAARLDQRVALVARVGDDTYGSALRAGLDAEGVDTAAVRTTMDVPSGLALITVDGQGENRIVVSPGANAHLTTDDVVASAELLASAVVTMVQLEVPHAAVVVAVEQAKGMVMLNPAPAATLPENVLDRIDVLVPNRVELAVLAGESVPATVDEVAELARELPARAGVVVTLGKDGALVVADGDVAHVPAMPVEVTDTTGAGDAFCGALADALARGSALRAAAEWAVRAAGIATTAAGAQTALPTRALVERSAVSR